MDAVSLRQTMRPPSPHAPTASLVCMVVVTLMTKEPDAEMQAMVDETRDPTGPTIIQAH